MCTQHVLSAAPKPVSYGYSPAKDEASTSLLVVRFSPDDTVGRITGHGESTLTRLQRTHDHEYYIDHYAWVVADGVLELHVWFAHGVANHTIALLIALGFSALDLPNLISELPPI